MRTIFQLHWCLDVISCLSLYNMYVCLSYQTVVLCAVVVLELFGLIMLSTVQRTCNVNLVFHSTEDRNSNKNVRFSKIVGHCFYRVA